MLTSKQRAYLRAQANALEPILHAGKGGISDTMVKQAEDALTARELIKGRVLETAPGHRAGYGGGYCRPHRRRGGAGGGTHLCAVPAEGEGFAIHPAPQMTDTCGRKEP